MQYLSKLPEISSIGVDGDIIKLELEQDVDMHPNDEHDPLVLVARYASQVVVTVGHVIDYKRFDGPEIGCRVKIKGVQVGFTIGAGD